MPVGVQCPISSSLGEFPAIRIGSGVLGFRPYWCPSDSIALPFAFYTWCFPFAAICHWISIVFLLHGRRIATHSVDPSLSHFLGEFPGLGLALIPDVVVSEAEPRLLSGLSPIARILSRGNPLGSGARLIGWRPVLAKSPLRHRVSAGFNEGGGATHQPSARQNG